MGFQKKNVETVDFKKSRFDFSHDYSTTAEFGEVQPSLCRLVATQDEHHSIKFGSVLRMSPLNVPVFGRVIMRYTTHFVPFSQIYPKWENVFSDVPTQFVNVGDSGYYETASIPRVLPSVSLKALMAVFCRGDYSSYAIYGRAGNAQIDNEWDPLNTTQINDNIISAFFSNTDSGNQIVGQSNMNYLDPLVFPDFQWTPSNSDFISYQHTTIGGGEYDLMLMLKLSSKGRRLYKVLTGLGYKPMFDGNLSVSLLPMLAYYKAYFDQYSIRQFDLWQNTYAYKLIKWIEDHGTCDINTLGSVDATLVSYFLSFLLEELSECWYVENTDYVSSALAPDGYLSSVAEETLAGLTYPAVRNGNGSYTTIDAVEKVGAFGSGSVNMNNGAVIQTQSTDPAIDRYLDAISLKLLKQLYLNVQRDSAIGYSIAERLKSRGYGGYVQNAKKYFLGSKSVQVNFNDITSMSETDVPLATTASKGLGYFNDERIEFDANEMGYIIQLVTIYPISKAVNALDPTLLGLNKYTFYNPQYDSLSYERVPFACVGHMNGTYYSGSSVNDGNTFGFHPRYTGFKASPSNVLNGCFSLRSAMTEFLPYTLDRVILQDFNIETDVRVVQGFAHFKTRDGYRGTTMPSAGRDWRVVANRYWKGNYNRVFYGNRPVVSYTDWGESTLGTINDRLPLPDNFVLNLEISHQSYAKMRPIEDSWNATDDEVKRNTGVDDVKQ